MCLAQYLTYSKLSIKTISILPWFSLKRQSSILEEQVCKDSMSWKLLSNRPCWEGWSGKCSGADTRFPAAHPRPDIQPLPHQACPETVDPAIITSNKPASACSAGSGPEPWPPEALIGIWLSPSQASTIYNNLLSPRAPPPTPCKPPCCQKHPEPWKSEDLDRGPPLAAF